MSLVTINILKDEKVVGKKTFSVKPNDASHKSHGYMIGYIQAINDRDNMSTEFVEVDKTDISSPDEIPVQIPRR